MDAEVANSDRQAFQLKGNLFALTVIELHVTDLEFINTELTKKVQQAPKFFSQIPVVLGLDKLDDYSQLDFPQVIETFRAHGLMPVAVRGAAEKDKSKILALGLANFSALRAGEQDKVVTVEAPKLALPAANDEIIIKEELIRPTKIVHQRVRSGQQVLALGADLVVVGAVSEGAELKADGNVHIYGTLRGRVHAGEQGNKNARIFCHALQAQFISIAGVHGVSDCIPQDLWSQPAQIYLLDGQLKVEPIV
jgi:septum site-determining protein MinC